MRYKDHSILALIPARGGSRGIPLKNLAPLAGRPLLAHTVSAALQAGCFADVVVSTDHGDIAAAARAAGAQTPFQRPPELAGDAAKSEPVAVHALQTLAEQGRTYDLLVFLQPTSPWRSAPVIRAGLDFFLDHGLTSLATVSPVAEHPLFMRTMAEDGRMTPLLTVPSDVRRQDLPPVYIVNGALYINRTADILAGRRANDNEYGYVLNRIAGLDINTPEDLAAAQALWDRHGEHIYALAAEREF